METAELKDYRKIVAETKIRDLTDDGICSQCGECCGNILPLSEDEIRTIRGYMRCHNISAHKIMAPYANIVIDMTCPFLNMGKRKEKCMIYDVRPEICRAFQCDREINEYGAHSIAHGKKAVNMRAEFFGK